jgi:HEAT repeats
MKRVVAMTAVVALAGAGMARAHDKRAAADAPALLADALREGKVDADTAAELTRWILSEKDDTVARGLAHALGSIDLTTHGPDGKQWDATARAMVALFGSALGDAAERRPRDASQWPELAALMGAAAPAVAQALHDLPPSDRETLAGFARILAPSATPMVPALLQALRHDQPEVRRGAAAALGVMGPAGRKAAGGLRHALDDPDPGVRDAAADALRRIGAERD